MWLEHRVQGTGLKEIRMEVGKDEGCPGPEQLCRPHKGTWILL